MIVYSGIDTLGLLDAPPYVVDASGKTFRDWCEKYILKSLRSLEGEPLTAMDLWGARCGILHTSTPVATVGREGRAHEIFYRFKDREGANLIADVPLPILDLDIHELILAFRAGGISLIGDLGNDPARSATANLRSQHFLRWGSIESPVAQK